MKAAGKPTEHALRTLLMGGAADLRVAGLRLRLTSFDTVFGGLPRANLTLELVDKDGRVLAEYAPDLVSLCEGETATLTDLDRLFDFKLTS